MFEEVKDILKIASIYLATVIGAGFASGQEIMQFFSRYYEGGFYGIILAGILFALIGYIVLVKVYSERIRNYEEFLFPTVGWFIGWVMEIMVTLFMGSVLCIMVAGLGNILSDAINIPYQYATLIAAILCMIAFLTDIKGIMVLSAFLTPIMVLGILGAGFYVIANTEISVFNPVSGLDAVTNNWLVSSLLYVSYNSISAVVVMCSLLPCLKSRRTAAAGGVVGGLMLSFIAIVLNILLYLFYPGIISDELPVLSIINRHNSILGELYKIVLFLAMFTSAITTGYGFIERIGNKIKVSRKILIPAICGFIVPISNVGFSELITSIYPVFGYMGMFMLFMILLQGLNMLVSTLRRSTAPTLRRGLYKNRNQ